MMLGVLPVSELAKQFTCGDSRNQAQNFSVFTQIETGIGVTDNATFGN